MAGFDTGELSERLGVNERLLRYWADKKVVRPSVQRATGRPGTKRRYSIRNAVQLAILNRLWRHGVNLEESRKLLKAIDDSGYFRFHPEPCLLVFSDEGKWSILIPQPSREHTQFAERKGRRGGREARDLLKRTADLRAEIEREGSGIVIAIHKINEEVRQKLG